MTPPTAKAVSQTISLLRSYPCPLAIKSGGHAPTAGMSSVAGGITIDLKLLDTVEFLGAKDWDGTVSEKKSWKDGWVGKDKWSGMVTRIGVGNRWNRVYAELEKHNVTVVGGRAGTVGVGGFVVGGEYSFLHERRVEDFYAENRTDLVAKGAFHSSLNPMAGRRIQFETLKSSSQMEHSPTSIVALIRHSSVLYVEVAVILAS